MLVPNNVVPEESSLASDSPLSNSHVRHPRRRMSVRDREERRVLCRIAVIEALYDTSTDVESIQDLQLQPPEQHYYSCITQSSLSTASGIPSTTVATLDVQVPDTFRSKYGAAIENGKAEFSLPLRYFDPVTQIITIPEDDNDWGDVQFVRELQEENQQEQVQKSMSGTKTVLAIRVKAPDGDAPETMDEIAAAIFGTSVDPNLIPIASVAAQYAAVSHNQLTLVPATGPGIFNGVAEITLNQTVQGARIQAELSSHILAVTAETLGPLDAIADRIIYCIPTGSLLQGRDSWTAYTHLFQHYSFFQQSRCTKLSVVMHELGHSFGFRHSGANLDDYGDETDYMGYAVNQYGMPRKAFNAHKHWVSGWYTDRSVRVYPELTGAVGAYLASFVDYSNPALDANAVILIRVGNLFIQFNEGKGYNVDTPAIARNHVVIAEATGPGEVSQLIGGVAVGEFFSYAGYSLEHDLRIEFCDQVVAPYGYAAISIHLDDGNQSSVCNDPSSFGAGGLFTESADNSPSVGAGSLVFEDQGSEASQQRQNAIIGVVWGLVALLILLSIYLLYRLHREKKKKRVPKTVKTIIPNEVLEKCPTDNSIGSEERVISGSC